MPTREERHEKFASALIGSSRPFPWPWHKTAAYVLELRKKAQLAPSAIDTATGSPGGERQKDEIIKNLVQVHQDQQASVAAAESEARTMRTELDTARKQMNQIYQQLQATQGQMQQMQAQAQQAIQQAKAQTDAVQQSMGPEIQKAQQNASTAADEATRARIELSRLQQIHEQVRQSVLQYKANVMNAVSQDPVTLAEAQRLQQDQQQQMQAQMLQQQQAQAQGVVNAQAQMSQAQRGVPAQVAQQQPGMVAQAAAGMPKTAAPLKGAENPISALSKAVAGGGDRSGFRRAIAAQTLSKAIDQGAKSPAGGLRIPFDSMAGQILQKRAELANGLRLQQRVVLLKEGQKAPGEDLQTFRNLRSAQEDAELEREMAGGVSQETQAAIDSANAALGQTAVPPEAPPGPQPPEWITEAQNAPAVPPGLDPSIVPGSAPISQYDPNLAAQQFQERQQAREADAARRSREQDAELESAMAGST